MTFDAVDVVEETKTDGTPDEPTPRFDCTSEPPHETLGAVAPPVVDYEEHSPDV